jgi:TolA-binding protein
MYLYRISIVCITACIFTLGCGGPSATEIYELERRISANEKKRTDTESTLNALADKTDQATQQLAQISSSSQPVEKRLGEIEQNLADLRTQLESIKLDQAEANETIQTSLLTKMEKRIVELENSLSAQANSIQPEKSPVGDRDTANAANAKMGDDPAVDKEASRKRSNRAKSRGFEITLYSWNVESEGSDPKVIAQQLSDTNRYDVYALCEVLPESIELYATALGDDYRTIASRSGYNDRLQIIYNAKKFELLQRLELNEINFEYRYRSPLVAHLRDKATKQQVMVLNNHLARGRAEVRTKQAEQLVEWARDQTVPIVAVGDYNFDYVFKTRKGNDGFTAMLRDNIWQWVEPVELIDTNWFDNPKNPDGRDDYEGSMLDFAFVAGAATEWKAECRVIVRPGDFPDDEKTSDHRPFELRLSTR